MNGPSNGNGAWADFPYYGSEKFWFIEDNTIKGIRRRSTSGGIDCSTVEDMSPDIITGGTQTRMATALKVGPVRGNGAVQIYNNMFNWTIDFWRISSFRQYIWHDNTFLGTILVMATIPLWLITEEYGAVSK